MTILSENKTMEGDGRSMRSFFMCGRPEGKSMFKEKCREALRRFSLLLKSVPCPLVVCFVMSVFCMNLLANKSISLPVGWLALDCGIVVSWFAFLVMDMITKHFGPKAATQLSVLAVACNLFFCLLFFLGSLIPGVWGESFVPGSEAAINGALDRTFGGTWYVVLGSTVAFLVSSIVNNFSNWGIGRLVRRRPDAWLAYMLRSYGSTALGQFCDNIIFALMVSHVFFGWTMLQCVTCALTGMLVELICEVLFSPLGYLACRRWQAHGVGAEYLAAEAEKKEGQT